MKYGSSYTEKVANDVSVLVYIGLRVKIPMWVLHVTAVSSGVDKINPPTHLPASRQVMQSRRVTKMLVLEEMHRAGFAPRHLMGNKQSDVQYASILYGVYLL